MLAPAACRQPVHLKSNKPAVLDCICRCCEYCTVNLPVFACLQADGPEDDLGSAMPVLRELDLSANLIGDWSFVVTLLQVLNKQ